MDIVFFSFHYTAHTSIAKVISWRLATHMCFLAFSHGIKTSLFPSHPLLFSHFSEPRCENTAERMFVSTGYRTHNHQVMNQTRSPLSPLGGVHDYIMRCFKYAGVKLYSARASLIWNIILIQDTLKLARLHP